MREVRTVELLSFSVHSLTGRMRIVAEMPEAHEDIPVEQGQFDDAPEEGMAVSTANELPPQRDPRSGHAYIDEPSLLGWSSDSSEESEPDEFDAEEDLMEEAAFHGLRAEDEDWEIAERGNATSRSKFGRRTHW